MMPSVDHRGPSPVPAQMDGPRRGYWCECWTEDTTSGTGETRLRGSIDAYSPSQADRWVAVALRTISPALEPPAAQQAWDWLEDGRIATRRALLAAEPCTVTITHQGTRITWSIRPVIFLQLAGRDGTLPACAERFAPPRGGVPYVS